ncbi:hypothetical protein H4696_003473 [Amycolatopsis lexingtonensis]|uniref:Uncharacterized protein n=1 Tax=Amycolatopsis lexingtonensis TaxID=218822 RepID=A0ABR9HZN7_9PSEU|nr:hypothetical protein [Amycolatopsis lexingtonensis]
MKVLIAAAGRHGATRAIGAEIRRPRRVQGADAGTAEVHELAAHAKLEGAQHGERPHGSLRPWRRSPLCSGPACARR